MNSKLSNAKTFLQAVIAFISIPILFSVIIIPVTLARTVVQLLAKLDRDLDGVMCGASALSYCGDSVHKKPLGNIIVALKVDGKVSFDRLINLTLKNILNLKKADGNLEFKELKQYVVTFLGFPFYKWDTNIKVGNYVKRERKIIESKEEFAEYVNTRIALGWRRGQSLWEIVLLENYQLEKKKSNSDETVILFRCHRSLADGPAITNLIRKLCGTKEPLLVSPLPNNNYEKKSICETVVECFIFPFRAVYECMEEFSCKSDENISRSKSKKIMSGRRNTKIFEKIPLGLVKRIKNRNSVAFQAVLGAAIAGGLRKYLKSQDFQITETFCAASAAPVPGHQDYFTNHFSYSFEKLPISVATPMRRLQICHQNQNEFRKSTLPLLYFLLPKIIGLCPMKIIETIALHVHNMSPVQLTIFPITSGTYILDDRLLADASTIVNCVDPQCGLAFTCTTYNDCVQLAMISDETIVPSSTEADNIEKFIAEEFNALDRLERE